LQGGIGVPFIAKWPGKIAKGRIDDTTPITAVDLLPTLLAIAGAKLPEGYVPDGMDQRAALLGKSTSVRVRPIFWQWHTASKHGENWPTLAVREGGWKLLLGKEPQQVELFRFPADRLEKHNARDKQANEVERLSGLIDDWKASLPAAPKSSCLSAQRSK
jgi:N-acetylgalactosamine-6-sulfatase